MSHKEQAKKLYDEYRNEYYFAGFNRNAFQQRLRRLARKVSRNAVNGDEVHAMMYLDNIATRLGIDLTFAD